MGNRIEFRDFGPSEYQELHERQEGMCALSGEPLNETATLHHIVPASHMGNRTPETNAFVADYQRNGVLVNDEAALDAGRDSGPHLAAHGGDFRDGPAATHGAFRYSHGSDQDAHERWASDNDAFVSREIFPNADIERSLGETHGNLPDIAAEFEELTCDSDDAETTAAEQTAERSPDHPDSPSDPDASDRIRG